MGSVLKREVVKQSFDTFIVNYFYGDSLLLKTLAKTKNAEFEFEQTTVHKYDARNVINEILTTHFFLNIESGDTIRNSLMVDTYNEKEQIIESQIINYTNPDLNQRRIYKYKCGRLISLEDYFEKNSLNSVTNFEYVYDEFKNWIERYSFEKRELVYIRKRT